MKKYKAPKCEVCNDESAITFNGVCNTCSPKMRLAVIEGRIYVEQVLGKWTPERAERARQADAEEAERCQIDTEKTSQKST